MDIEFHTLTVAKVEPLTDDSVAVTFDVPPALSDTFTHVPGQYLVLRAELDGDDVRRSYSICSPPGQPPTVGIKRIPDGVFSTFATTELAAGDTLEVLAPAGEFTKPVNDRGEGGRYVAVAAGSGITPVLSIVASTLAAEADSHVTLLYGNRTARSIMFLERIEALKNRYPERLQVIHVLSREPHQVPLFQGRIDAEKIRGLAETLVDVSAIDGWYLCGPLDMVECVSETVQQLGVPEDRVHYELFFDQRIEAIPEPVEDDADLVHVEVTIDGRTSVVKAKRDGPSLLDYARSVRAEVPFACKGGMCATCKAAVVEGEVTMEKNYALTKDELDSGFVLTCQAHPVTDRVGISYDTHGGLGR